MKRRWTVLVTLFALCAVLVGCGKAKVDYKEAFTGSWDLVSLVDNGGEPQTEEITQLGNQGLHTYLDLNEDGSSTLDLYGAKLQGTWTESGDGQGVVVLQNVSTPITLKDDQLVMMHDTSMLTFNKIDPSQKVAQATTGTEASTSLSAGGEAVYFGGDTIDSLEDVTEIYETLIDDETCTITAVAKGMYDGDPGYLFEFTNKTDKDVLFNAIEGWTVDGTKVPVTLYETVKAGETLGSIAFFNASDVGTSADELGEISGTIYLLDASDSETIVGSYTFTL